MRIRNNIITILVIIILCAPFFSSEVFALSEKQKERANKIGGFLVSEVGLKPYVAFGVLGNIYQESGFNPGSVNSSSGASGICQWTDGRRKNMIKQCGSDWKKDLDGQLQYLKYELEHDYSKVLKALKKLPDNKKGMKRAAEIFCKDFEVCGNYGEEFPRRINHAEMLYKELDGKLDGYSAGSSEPYDFSIIQEFFSPIMSLKLTDGSILSTTKKEKEERKKINTKILNTTVEGSTGKKYSVYERFGPKLQFMMYNGEVTENIELADHIISAYVTGNDKNLELKEDIIKYQPHIYLSTRVYKDRPPVLDVTQVKNGYIDSRVTLYKSGDTGKLYSLYFAKIKLAISSFIVGIVNLFTDNKFFVFILSAFKTVVESPAWEVVKVGVNCILFIFIGAFIFSLVKHAIRFANGREGMMPFFTRAGIGALSIGLAILFMTSPANMLDKSSKVVTFIDDIVNESISVTFKDKPAIYSEDGKHAMNAAVWNTALFEPWCKALFDRPYESCYTQYAKVSEDKKLPQSYEPDHENPVNSEDEDIFYDSAGCTGDVFVDLGGGKKERNWAAYALSTMSIYHIGHEVYENEKDVTKFNRFPNAMTTYRDKNLYADTFRWIDAKMNISPQYSINGEESEVFNSYGDSTGFETHYYKYSWQMLWHAILLAMLIPVIWFRLKAFLGIMYVAIKGIYYSLVELIKENNGLSAFWDDIKDNFIKYLYHSIQLYILLFLYVTLVGTTNFFLEVVYIVLCFVISATTPRDIRNRARHLREDVKRITTK